MSGSKRRARLRRCLPRSAPACRKLIRLDCDPGNAYRRVSQPKEESMRVSDAMTAAVRIATPQQSICEAAQMMAEIDSGVLPVGDGDRLVGMLTDRDIA